LRVYEVQIHENADIKRILEDKHACTSEEERDAAMRRPCDFKYGEVWLMVKMGYINPPRPLGKHRLQKMDAETLKAEHAHICWASALGDMKTEKIISKIGKRMGRSLTKRWNWTRRGRRTPAEISQVHVMCANP